jgi:hypothetical protein
MASQDPEVPARAPQRVQLRRSKGWRKPEGVVVVARPSRWGNPFTTADAGSRAAALVAFRTRLAGPPEARHYPTDEEIRAELRGRDLGCWCPLDGPCHADVLLEIANREDV